MEDRVRAHPEFVQFGEGGEFRAEGGPLLTQEIGRDVKFRKYGNEIFQVDSADDDGDWDWPDLVGGALLTGILRDAAREVGPGKDIRPYVTPSEKGWVELGYMRFLTPDLSHQQRQREAGKRALDKAVRAFRDVLRETWIPCAHRGVARWRAPRTSAARRTTPRRCAP